MVIGRPDAPVLCVLTSAPAGDVSQWFITMLAKAGISEDDVCFLTILDEPPDNKGDRPSAAQMKEAVAVLRENFERVQPRVVVPVGGPALQVTTGLQVSIADARGYLIPPSLRGVFTYQSFEQIGLYKTNNKKYGRKIGDPRFGWVSKACPGCLPSAYAGYVIPTYGLYQVQSTQFALAHAVKADLARVRRALDGHLAPIDRNLTFFTSFHTRRLPDGTSIYDESGRDDYTGPLLAVDIETNYPVNDTIERFSVSDGVRTHTLPWDPIHRAWLARQIQIKRDWLIFHNVSFDVPHLRRAGMPITQEMEETCLFDSMFGGVIVLPDLPKSLGSMASIHLDTTPWKWDELSAKDPERYSAKDAYVTALLVKVSLEPMLRQTKMWPLATGRDYRWGPGVMATVPVLSDMNQQGLRKNFTYAMKWADELHVKLSSLMRKWQDLFPDVDPTSKQLIDLFYTTWKLPVVRSKGKKDKPGGITTDELAVVKSRAYIQSEYARTRDNSPWKTDPRCTPSTFDLLLDIRETDKQLNTYCAPILMDPDEYVHPSYLPEAKDEENRWGVGKGNTATGRLAAMHPNIQNQTLAARYLYLPDRDDLCFVQADFTRAELFAMAAMAKDQIMMEDLKVDPYQKIADLSKTERKTSKNVVLAGQYLAGDQKVSDMIMRREHIYISPAECRHILDTINVRWRQRTRYANEIATECRAKGFLVNPFGRVRVFHDRKGPAAVNFIPQSIVADIIWCVLRPIWLMARELGGRLTTTVHDSILVQVPEAQVYECMRRMKEIMERTFDCVAPGFFIPVSFEVGAPGASWGDLKEVA